MSIVFVSFGGLIVRSCMCLICVILDVFVGMG